MSPVFIFLVNILLIVPLFFGEYTKHMGSIESAFIFDALFIEENTFANWNPLWYCGSPFHLSYTPLIPYLSVIIHSLIRTISIPQSFRIINALAYAFTPVSLFLFVKYLTHRELTAFTTSIIYSVALMPLYSLIPFGAELITNFQFVPYRLIALMIFGESPHLFGLATIPLASIALMQALRRPCFKHFFFTSLTIAVVALTNLIALYALVLISFTILLSEIFNGEYMEKIKTTLICGVLSYGLVAFFYDLSFIKASVSFGIYGSDYVFTWWNFAEIFIILATILSFLSIYFKKKPESQSLFIAASWSVIFFIIVSIWYFFKIPLSPQPSRYMPELNIGISFLLGIAITNIIDKLAKAVLIREIYVLKISIFIIITLIVLTLPFIKSTWEITNPNQVIEKTPEYTVSKWLDTYSGEHRAFATGTVCFWLNVFTKVPQLRGGSDQGSTNPFWMDVTEEFIYGNDGQLDVLWCKALGIKYIVVVYPNADTPYHDYIFPNKFEGILPLRYAYKGFGVFEVPYENSELIQLVDLAHLKNFRQIKTAKDIEGLSNYVNFIELTPPALVYYQFYQVDNLEINVINATESTAILVKMTFDKRWKAYVDGEEVGIVEIGPSFMLIPPNKKGNYNLALVCGKNVSEVVGIAISILTIITILVFSAYRLRRSRL